ncbi:MAG: FkbM family methyltransferase [Nitrospira sp.]|nr:FkbM family methyltransferase [Nitrospira sp.]
MTLQAMVNVARRVIPRGWAPLIASAARVVPSLQQYRARLKDGGEIYLDLREFMCFSCFFYGELPHEQGTEKLLRRVLKEGGTFVDVGANIGYFTKFASKLVGARGRVFAFEPMPAALRLLRMNTAPLPNVTIFPVALSDTKGMATFYVRKKGDMSSLSYDSGATPVPVTVSTLDESLADQARIDLIKIDVEGSELEVLRGGRLILQRHRPIVYFEFLPCFAEPKGIRVETFEELFKPLGYSLRWINHSPSDPSLISDTPSTYVIAIPQGRERELE